jgi:hypothetical protein
MAHADAASSVQGEHVVCSLRCGSGGRAVLLFTLVETNSESVVIPILASSRAHAVREIIRRRLVPREVLLGIGDLVKFQKEVDAPPPALGLTAKQETAYLANLKEAEFDARLMALAVLHNDCKETPMYSLDGPHLPPHGLIIADESEDEAQSEQQQPLSNINTVTSRAHLDFGITPTSIAAGTVLHADSGVTPLPRMENAQPRGAAPLLCTPSSSLVHGHIRFQPDAGWAQRI